MNHSLGALALVSCLWVAGGLWQREASLAEATPITVQPQVGIVFWVRDIEASAMWFRKVLGTRADLMRPEIGYAELITQVPGVRINLARGTRPRRNNVVPTFHVADLDAALLELAALGVMPLRPPTEMPGLARLASILDLDGNELQLVQPLGDRARVGEATRCLAPGPFADVDFLVGAWRSVPSDPATEEVWTGAHQDTMYGTSRTSKAGQLQDFALMRIVRRADALVFLAEARGQNPLELPLTHKSANRVTFANLGLALPKRIRYWLDEHRELRAVIDDGKDGGKTVEFHWRRI